MKATIHMGGKQLMSGDCTIYVGETLMLATSEDDYEPEPEIEPRNRHERRARAARLRKLRSAR